METKYDLAFRKILENIHADSDGLIEQITEDIEDEKGELTDKEWKAYQERVGELLGLCEELLSKYKPVNNGLETILIEK